MEFTTALARLLSDATLRQAYRRDRCAVARQLSIREVDVHAFLHLDVSSLDAQAEMLLNKRFHEVSQLLPQTLPFLGDSARRHFRAYAATDWPKGYTRHIDDAVAFCRYLIKHRVCKVCRAEFNRLWFRKGRKRLTIHFVPDLMIDGRPRGALQLLYRRRDHSCGHYALYLDFSWMRSMLRIANPRFRL